MDEPEPTPPNCRVGKVTFHDGSSVVRDGNLWTAYTPHRVEVFPQSCDLYWAVVYLSMYGYGPAATGATS